MLTRLNHCCSSRLREQRVVDQDAGLDVSGLTSIGEVGRGDERAFMIDDQALRMQAGEALGSAVRGS